MAIRACLDHMRRFVRECSDHRFPLVAWDETEPLVANVMVFFQVIDVFMVQVNGFDIRMVKDGVIFENMIFFLAI